MATSLTTFKPLLRRRRAGNATASPLARAITDPRSAFGVDPVARRTSVTADKARGGYVNQRTKRQARRSAVGMAGNPLSRKTLENRIESTYGTLQGLKKAKVSADPKRLAALRGRVRGLRQGLASEVLGKKAGTFKTSHARAMALRGRLGSRYSDLYAVKAPRKRRKTGSATATPL